MTKEYVKPQISFEEFSLSTNIAASCEGIVGNPSKGTCAVIGTGEQYMFSSTITQCDFSPSVEDQWDGFCYHVPTDEKSLFNS